MPNWVRQRVIAKEPQMLKKYLLNENGVVDFNILKPMPQELSITSGSYSYDTPSRFSISGDEERLKRQEKITQKLEEHYTNKISQAEFCTNVMNDKSLIKAIKEYKGVKLRKTKDMEQTGWVMSRKNFIELIDTYVKGFFNLKRYGHKDWYDWSITNWGTKWNASSYEQNTEDIEGWGIEFETAWSMPHPIYAELAKYTPIRVVYADEDIGSNCGMYDFYTNEYGEVEFTEVMEGSEELAYDTWGYGTFPVYTNDEDYEEIIEGDFQNKEQEIMFNKAQKAYNEVQNEISELMTTNCLAQDYAEV